MIIIKHLKYQLKIRVGAYVAVHLYKNNNNQNSANNSAARAIGLSWFKIEKSQIKVTIDLPETILPNTTLTCL